MVTFRSMMSYMVKTEEMMRVATSSITNTFKASNHPWQMRKNKTTWYSRYEVKERTNFRITRSISMAISTCTTNHIIQKLLLYKRTHVRWYHITIHCRVLSSPKLRILFLICSKPRYESDEWISQPFSWRNTRYEKRNDPTLFKITCCCCCCCCCCGRGRGFAFAKSPRYGVWQNTGQHTKKKKQL